MTADTHHAYSRPFTDEERAELDAYRQGSCSIAFDPVSPGRVVHPMDTQGGEQTYHVQETHRGQLVWICACCVRFTVGGLADDPCVGCGERDLSYVPSVSLACKSWSETDGGRYAGRCLIVGSDGCECPGVDGER